MLWCTGGFPWRRLDVTKSWLEHIETCDGKWKMAFWRGNCRNRRITGGEPPVLLRKLCSIQMLVGKRHVTTSLQTFQAFPNHVKIKRRKLAGFQLSNEKKEPLWLLRRLYEGFKKKTETVLYGLYDIRDYNISHYKDPYESTISADSQAGRVSSTDTTRDQTPMVPWGGRSWSFPKLLGPWSHNDIILCGFFHGFLLVWNVSKLFFLEQFWQFLIPDLGFMHASGRWIQDFNQDK